MTTQNKIPAFGGKQDILVPSGSKIAIGSYGAGVASIFYKSGPGNNNPDTYYLQQTLTNAEVTLGTFTADRYVSIDAGADDVFYAVGTAPVLSFLSPKIAARVQAAQTAKTVSATLTAAEILAGLITVNQGAGAASTLTLPLATAMDTALPDFAADMAVDFSLINVSTVAAEDAAIATNTGWTLVGNMDVQSNDAATSKSAGRFRARKTAAGAWTLYRLS